MKTDWTPLAEASDNVYKVEDFKRAAYMLVTKQVIYESMNREKLYFRIIREHQSAFTEVCAMLGMDLRVDTTNGYVAARPVLEEGNRLDLESTFFILVLRKLYDEKMREGEAEVGRVKVTLDQLQARYQQSTNRAWYSNQSEVKQMLKQMRRYGIAREIPTEAGELQPFAVEILPAIEYLIDEPLIHQMQALLGYDVTEHLDDDLNDQDTEESIHETA